MVYKIDICRMEIQCNYENIFGRICLHRLMSSGYTEIVLHVIVMSLYDDIKSRPASGQKSK